MPKKANDAMTGNRGIIVTGGSFSAGAVAAGDHAVALGSPPNEETLTELRDTLAKLEEAIEKHEAELIGAGPARESARAALAAARRTPVDRSQILEFLQQ